METLKIIQTTKLMCTICYFLFVCSFTACGGGGSIGSKLDVALPKPAPQVSLFAGSVRRIGGTIDGPFSNASFVSPQSVAVDKQGNAYVADHICSLRRIAPNGFVSTFTGSFLATSRNECSFGSESAENGALVIFSNINAVATSPSGRVYLADGSAIRYIDPNGYFNTIAGSSGIGGDIDANGLEASFSDPGGLATDRAGNVFVADTGNGRIRKISLNGDVTTILNLRKRNVSDDIVAIAVDSLGNLFFVDRISGTVYKAKAESYAVIPLDLGFGVVGLESPQGIAADSKGNVFVADSGNRVIRKIPPTGMSTIFAGEFGVAGVRDGLGAGARFFFPNGLAADVFDNIYVADVNGTVRKITPDGVVTTIGGSADGYGNDDDIGTNATFGRSGEPATTVAGSRVFNGISKDSRGNFYVADTFNHTIRKITPDRRVTTLAGKAGIKGFNDGQGDGARFSYPAGIVVDNSDAIYVSDSENHTIRKISLDGTVTTFAGAVSIPGADDGTGTAAKFNHPTSIALDSQGFLIVSDSENHKIRKISKTGVVTTAQPSLAPDYPLAVVADKKGNYFFTSVFCYCIFKTDVNGLTTKFAGGNVAGNLDGKGSAARFNYLRGLSMDESGNIFTDDYGQIKKITPDGDVKTLDLASSNYSLSGNLVFIGSTAYSMSENAIFQILNAR